MDTILLDETLSIDKIACGEGLDQVPWLKIGLHQLNQLCHALFLIEI